MRFLDVSMVVYIKEFKPLVIAGSLLDHHIAKVFPNKGITAHYATTSLFETCIFDVQRAGNWMG
jgi:hypothetical protein